MNNQDNRLKCFQATNFLRSFQSGLFFFTILFCSYSSSGQGEKPAIAISVSQYALPLLEKWCHDYTKINAGITFKFIGNSSPEKADLILSESKSDEKGNGTNLKIVNVGRMAVLPVTNSNNKQIAKRLKNGIGQEELKNLFLPSESDVKEENSLYTVYTYSSKSTIAKVFTDHFDLTGNELTGVTVTGEDKYLIESVLGDSTGISFSNLGLIYDLTSRKPLTGLKILPVELEKDGKWKKDKLVYDNLDQIISYLESTNNQTIPTGNINFGFRAQSSKPEVSDFVGWVTGSGQQYNHQFGFLKSTAQVNSSLTLK